MERYVAGFDAALLSAAHASTVVVEASAIEDGRSAHGRSGRAA